MATNVELILKETELAKFYQLVEDIEIAMMVTLSQETVAFGNRIPA
jgi:hypothetical protein